MKKRNKQKSTELNVESVDVEQVPNDNACDDLICKNAAEHTSCKEKESEQTEVKNVNAQGVAEEEKTDSVKNKKVTRSSIFNKKGLKPKSPKGVEYIEVGTYRSDVRVKEKASLLNKLSAVWTILSTVYAIFSTCLFVARDWVSNTVSYVLIGILSAYILVFIALVVFVIRNPKKGTRTAKYYKKVLKIYKTVINLTFLILTAISIAGMAASDMSAGKWFMFIMSFIIATVQLVFGIVTLVMKLISRWIAKKFKVKIENYKDGKKQKNTLLDTMTEKKYKD